MAKRKGRDRDRQPAADDLHATYLDQKRYLLFFSGVLFLTGTIDLAKSAGFTLPGTNLQIANPQELRFVLFGIVGFYLWQLSLFWDAQGAPSRERVQHKSDHISSLVIGFSALLTLPVSMILGAPVIGTIFHSLAPWALIALLFVIPVAGALLYWLGFRRSVRGSVEKAVQKQQALVEALRRYNWELVFDPLLYNRTAQAEGSKLMAFGSDGEIEEGRNVNENFWVASGKYLELYRQTGALNSRFELADDGKTMMQTYDFDQAILPVGQCLVRKEERGAFFDDLTAKQS